MPAKIVPSDSGFSIPKYSVLGKYAQGARPKFVKHLAIVREETPVKLGDEVTVWEMQPPLFAGQQKAVCPAHIAAWVTLTSEEREGIADWLAGVDKENRPKLPTRKQKLDQYTVSLNEDDLWHKDEKGTPIYRKFSCASFVFFAYRDGAYIQLIDVNGPEKLPKVDIDMIDQAYGPGLESHEELRETVGIPGNGPWHVLLPGYICHAMSRPDETIREKPFVVPGVEAAQFPRSA